MTTSPGTVDASGSKSSELAAELMTLGLAVDVDVHEGVAVLRAGPAVIDQLLASRLEVVRVARRHGFSHVAVAL
jgi:hypothetical protein